VDKILTTRSSIIGSDAIYRKPKSSLLCVLVLEGTLSLDRCRDLFQTRIVDPKFPNGKFKKTRLATVCHETLWLLILEMGESL